MGTLSQLFPLFLVVTKLSFTILTLNLLYPISTSFKWIGHNLINKKMGSSNSKHHLPKEVQQKIEEILKDRRIENPDKKVHQLILATNAILEELAPVDRKIADVRLLITLSLTKAADAGSPFNQGLWREMRELRAARDALISRALNERPEDAAGEAI